MKQDPICPICGDATAPDMAAWRFLALDQAPKNYVVLHCNGCGLRWLDPYPLPEDYQTIYGIGYYGNGRQIGGAYQEGTRERAPCDAAIARRLYIMGVTDGLLDVGCGTGDFLLEAARTGVDGEGVEPSDYAALTARSRGLRVHHGTLGDLPNPPALYAAAHCCHVLEHVPDAHAFLEQLRNLLRPAAPVYIEVPQQFDSILDRIARRLGRKNCYSEYSIHHHYFFSPNALTALLEANGFEITSMTSFLRCRRQGRRSGPRKWALQTLLQVANILGRRGDVIAVWARRTR